MSGHPNRQPAPLPIRDLIELVVKHARWPRTFAALRRGPNHSRRRPLPDEPGAMELNALRPLWADTAARATAFGVVGEIGALQGAIGVVAESIRRTALFLLRTAPGTFQRAGAGFLRPGNRSSPARLRAGYLVSALTGEQPSQARDRPSRITSPNPPIHLLYPQDATNRQIGFTLPLKSAHPP